MIAHKFKVTNPQDYGLYVLVDGVGQCLCLRQSMPNRHSISDIKTQIPHVLKY